MSSQGEHVLHSHEQIKQLAAENQALQSQLSQVHAFYQAKIERLETRLAVEKVYQESQARFKTIFEQSKLGNKIIAADLRIIRVNQALARMLGYTKAELEGSRILDYVRADYLGPWRELQENLWTKQIPSFGMETLLVKKDGSELWCRVTSILFTDEGETLGYTILEDITPRKALEAKLQKMYDAQETLMHTVAHDLKSPIHIIITLTGFLKKQIAKLVAIHSLEPSLTHLTMIEQACQKAYGVIRDLLLIGEIESPDQTFRKETTELKEFIQAQVALFGLTAQEKGVTLSLQLPAEPVYASINSEKLARVLENLLSNAVKFTRQGGQVLIALQEEAKTVTLQVQDNGVGIPASLQANVFDKFTKANRQGTEGETTTGLGLFIARQIVGLHQGRIWLESEEQKGTTFYIKLPKG